MKNMTRPSPRVFILILWFCCFYFDSWAQQQEIEISRVELDLNAPVDGSFVLPATMKLSGILPGQETFFGVNNKPERGSPLYSTLVESGSIFFPIEIVEGFPLPTASVRPIPNRKGGSSFIAVKDFNSAEQKIWINASYGAFSTSGADWEYQVRYYDGPDSTSIVIGTVPNSDNWSPDDVITDFDVRIFSNSCRQDSLALVELYNNTAGDFWDSNQNWLSDSLSTWQGITVDNNNPDGCVTHINLANNKLEGALPPKLGNLQALESLIVSNNPLINQLPTELSDLKSLQELNVSNTDMSGKMPPSFHKLESLQYLNYENTDICLPSDSLFANWYNNIPEVIGLENYCLEISGFVNRLSFNELRHEYSRIPHTGAKVFLYENEQLIDSTVTQDGSFSFTNLNESDRNKLFTIVAEAEGFSSGDIIRRKKEGLTGTILDHDIEIDLPIGLINRKRKIINDLEGQVNYNEEKAKQLLDEWTHEDINNSELTDEALTRLILSERVFFDMYINLEPVVKEFSTVITEAIIKKVVMAKFREVITKKLKTEEKIPEGVRSQFDKVLKKITDIENQLGEKIQTITPKKWQDTMKDVLSILHKKVAKKINDKLSISENITVNFEKLLVMEGTEFLTERLMSVYTQLTQDELNKAVDHANTLKFTGDIFSSSVAVEGITKKNLTENSEAENISSTFRESADEFGTVGDFLDGFEKVSKIGPQIKTVGAFTKSMEYLGKISSILISSKRIYETYSNDLLDGVAAAYQGSSDTLQTPLGKLAHVSNDRNLFLKSNQLAESSLNDGIGSYITKLDEIATYISAARNDDLLNVWEELFIIEESLEEHLFTSQLPAYLAFQEKEDSTDNFRESFNEMVEVNSQSAIERFILHGTLISHILENHSYTDSLLVQINKTKSILTNLGTQIQSANELIGDIPITGFVYTPEHRIEKEPIKPGEVLKVSARIKNVGGAVADSLIVKLEVDQSLSIQSQASYNLESLTSGQEQWLEWEVQARDVGSSLGYYSIIIESSNARSIPSSRQFTIEIPLEAPLIVQPMDGAIDVNLSPTLEWNPVNGAVSYQVQVTEDSGFNTLFVDSTGVVGTQLNLTDLQEQTDYWWRMRSLSENYVSAWSPVWQFTTTENNNDLPGNNVQNKWVWQNPLPQANMLNSITFLNDLEAWAVGWEGTIIHTKDGGKTWTHQYSGLTDARSGTKTHFSSVNFINNNDGWIVGGGSILSTNDGGDNWIVQLQSGDLTVNLQDLKFVDKNHGWAVGKGVLYTSNGGKSWEVQDTHTGLNAVEFIDNRSGWAVGSSGLIIYTNDGGNKWKVQNSGTSAKINDVVFIDTLNGWAVGEYGTLIHTKNAGETWLPQNLDPNVWFFSVDFVDENFGWAVGSDRRSPQNPQNVVLHTVDGGKNWVVQHSLSYDSCLYDISMAVNGTGWAVGCNGEILKTMDGGNSWNSLREGILVRGIADISFKNIREGWALAANSSGDINNGNESFILNTFDSGSSWNIQKRLEERLVAFDFSGDRNGWIVGAKGKIFNTRDGGENWTLQKSGTSSTLKDVHFIDQKNGWAIGSYPLTILNTKDGGENWNIQYNGALVTPTKQEIIFVDANHGWTLLSSSTVMRTTDGGKTWHPLSVGNDYPLTAITFIDKKLGWVVGFREILHTSDGGNTWISQTPSERVSESYHDVAFIDPNKGLIMGPFGRIFYTNDGGNNWIGSGANPEIHEYSTTHFGTDLAQGIYFPNSEHGWLIGSGGTILKYGGEVPLETINIPATVTAQANRSFGASAAPQDYRLVALPGAMDEPLEHVLDGAPGVTWQAFWDNGSQQNYLHKYDGSERFTMVPGNGFWVTSTGPFQFDQTLPMVELNQFHEARIPLHEGWNIISNPLDIDVYWDEVAAANFVELQPIWSFEGSFEIPESFRSAKSGEAFYFLNNMGLEELLIPYKPTVETQKPKANQPALQLSTFVDGNKTSSSRIVFVENLKNGSPNVVAPPEDFGGTSLRFIGDVKQEKTQRSGTLARIYSDPKTKDKSFDLVLAATPDVPVTITFEGVNVGDISDNVILIDKETGLTFDFKSDGQVTFVPQKEKTPFVFALGDKTFLDQLQNRFLPKQVEVYPNYPNPFNPSTTIKFALPQKDRVRLNVFDIIGRRVATLINEERPAGVHTVRFDASRLASGMYFAVVEIGQKHFVQKMMLIK